MLNCPILCVVVHRQPIAKCPVPRCQIYQTLNNVFNCSSLLSSQFFDAVHLFAMVWQFVAILLLGACLLGVSYVSGQQIPTTQVHACHGRPNGFARDLDNCQQYFVCQNGNPIRARCPGNLAFDANNQVCWWRDDVTCFRCPQDHLYSLLSVPHTCNQFYRCWRGRATIHTCPGALIFHPLRRRCAPLPGSGCPGDTIIPEGCPAQDGPVPVYMTHASNCGAYFICEHGRPREVQCEEGLHFNANLRICDVPEKANCRVQV